MYYTEEQIKEAAKRANIESEYIDYFIIKLRKLVGVDEVKFFQNYFAKEVEFQKTQTDPLVAQRYAIMFLLKQHTKMTLKHIGMIFGKDHSTVIHAIEVVQNAKLTNYRLILDHLAFYQSKMIVDGVINVN